MESSGGRPRTIVLGVIGFDCHSVGNKIMEAYFTEKGYRVVNLGVMVGQDEFVSAAIESAADAVLVSSLYGHGEIDCEGLRGRCVERGIGDVILWVGGNLVVGKKEFGEVEEKFRAMGYDRVFPPDADLDAVEAELAAAVDERRQRKAGA